MLARDCHVSIGPDGRGSLLGGEPAQRGGRIDRWEGCVRVAAWVSSHDGFTAARFRSRRADRIFEIGPREQERAPHDLIGHC